MSPLIDKLANIIYILERGYTHFMITHISILIILQITYNKMRSIVETARRRPDGDSSNVEPWILELRKQVYYYLRLLSCSWPNLGFTSLLGFCIVLSTSMLLSRLNQRVHPSVDGRHLPALDFALNPEAGAQSLRQKLLFLLEDIIDPLQNTLIKLRAQKRLHVNEATGPLGGLAPQYRDQQDKVITESSDLFNLDRDSSPAQSLLGDLFGIEWTAEKEEQMKLLEEAHRYLIELKSIDPAKTHIWPITRTLEMIKFFGKTWFKLYIFHYLTFYVGITCIFLNNAYMINDYGLMEEIAGPRTRLGRLLISQILVVIAIDAHRSGCVLGTSWLNFIDQYIQIRDIKTDLKLNLEHISNYWLFIRRWKMLSQRLGLDNNNNAMNPRTLMLYQERHFRTECQRLMIKCYVKVRLFMFQFKEVNHIHSRSLTALLCYTILNILVMLRFYSNVNRVELLTIVSSTFFYLSAINFAFMPPAMLNNMCLSMMKDFSTLLACCVLDESNFEESKVLDPWASDCDTSTIISRQVLQLGLRITSDSRRFIDSLCIKIMGFHLVNGQNIFKCNIMFIGTLMLFFIYKE